MKPILDLWDDDTGALIATEYLFLVTIVVIGIVVGLATLRTAINAELTELANAILALSQGYSVEGSFSGGNTVDGSQAIDTPGFIDGPIPTSPFMPSPIDVTVPGN